MAEKEEKSPSDNPEEIAALHERLCRAADLVGDWDAQMRIWGWSVISLDYDPGPLRNPVYLSEFHTDEVAVVGFWDHDAEWLLRRQIHRGNGEPEGPPAGWALAGPWWNTDFIDRVQALRHGGV